MRALLDRLTRKNPTSGFGAATIHELAYDFRSCRLSGVALGSPLAALAPFGVADRATRGSGDALELDYHRHGLRIDVGEGTVDEFGLLFDPRANHASAHSPAVCTLEFPDGRTLRASSTTTSEVLRGHLGEPNDTSDLVGRPTLEYLGAGATHALFEFRPEDATLVRASFSESFGRDEEPGPETR